MHVFGSSPGQVAVFRSPESVGAAVVIDGLSDKTGAYDLMRCAVTSLGLGEKVNMQLSPSLSGLLYVYVFGDAPAAVEINGVHFSNPCDGQPSGMERIHRYWRANRASRRRATVGLAVGGKIAVKGFLSDISLGSPDPQTGFGTFKLTLLYMPTD